MLYGDREFTGTRDKSGEYACGGRGRLFGGVTKAFGRKNGAPQRKRAGEMGTVSKYQQVPEGRSGIAGIVGDIC